MKLPDLALIKLDVEEHYRPPLIHRDIDVIEMAVWAARIQGGNALDVTVVGLGLLKLLDVLKGVSLSRQEWLDLKDLQELSNLLDSMTQEGWLTYLTGCKHRLAGLDVQPPPPPPKREQTRRRDGLTNVPRCAPDNPQFGHIDVGDDARAPVHGNVNRYTSKIYRCRCEHCRLANTVKMRRYVANKRARDLQDDSVSA